MLLQFVLPLPLLSEGLQLGIDVDILRGSAGQQGHVGRDRGTKLLYRYLFPTDPPL